MKKTLNTLIFIIVNIFILLLFVWEITFGLYLSSILLLFLVFLPFLILHKVKNLKIKILVSAMVLILFFLSLSLQIYEFNKRVLFLSKKLNNKNPFTLKDKIGIYGLNLALGIIAYPIFPEVSKETLFLMFYPPPNGKRIFRSNLFLKSKRIKNFIDKSILKFKQEKVLKKSYEGKIVWDYNSLSLKELRFALAFNSSHIIVKIEKEKNNKIVVDVILRVKIKYPKRSLVSILRFKGYNILIMEEGLLYVLEKDGWLFPYTAEWHLKNKIIKR